MIYRNFGCLNGSIETILASKLTSLGLYQKALYETFIYKKNPNNIKLNKS